MTVNFTGYKTFVFEHTSFEKNKDKQKADFDAYKKKMENKAISLLARTNHSFEGIFLVDTNIEEINPIGNIEDHMNDETIFLKDGGK